MLKDAVLYYSVFYLLVDPFKGFLKYNGHVHPIFVNKIVRFEFMVVFQILRMVKLIPVYYRLIRDSYFFGIRSREDSFDGIDDGRRYRNSVQVRVGCDRELSFSWK